MTWESSEEIEDRAYAEAWSEACAACRAAIAALDTTVLSTTATGVVISGRAKRAALDAIDLVGRGDS